MRTQEEILSDNAKFNALPPMEKRLAIARDILSQLEVGAFIPGDGYGNEFGGPYLPPGDLQQHLNNGVAPRRLF